MAQSFHVGTDEGSKFPDASSRTWLPVQIPERSAKRRTRAPSLTPLTGAEGWFGEYPSQPRSLADSSIGTQRSARYRRFNLTCHFDCGVLTG